MPDQIAIKDITPRILDAMINGVKVRVYDSPAKGLYATTHDFEHFGTKEIANFRVRPDHKDWSVDNCPIVKAEIDKLRAERGQKPLVQVGAEPAGHSP